MKLYVEGGGDSHLLRTACRQGFTTFLERAGLTGHMPRIVASGGRQQAYDDYCTAIENGEEALLLVDSEAPVAQVAQPGDGNDEVSRQAWLPWSHLKTRDNWDMPANGEELQCHLMVQCMETWFLADREVLKGYFNQGFKDNQLPAANNPIETVAKKQVYDSLANATHNCKTKTQYGKGEHSFKLLALVDPAKVTAASPWVKRFVDALKKKMGA